MGGQHRHGEYAKEFMLLEVASRHFRKDKVDLVSMVVMVGMEDNMDMVDNGNMVDIIYN